MANRKIIAKLRLKRKSTIIYMLAYISHYLLSKFNHRRNQIRWVSNVSILTLITTIIWPTTQQFLIYLATTRRCSKISTIAIFYCLHPLHMNEIYQFVVAKFLRYFDMVSIAKIYIILAVSDLFLKMFLDELLLIKKVYFAMWQGNITMIISILCNVYD